MGNMLKFAGCFGGNLGDASPCSKNPAEADRRYGCQPCLASTFPQPPGWRSISQVKMLLSLAVLACKVRGRVTGTHVMGWIGSALLLDSIAETRNLCPRPPTSPGDMQRVDSTHPPALTMLGSWLPCSCC